MTDYDKLFIKFIRDCLKFNKTKRRPELLNEYDYIDCKLYPFKDASDILSAHEDLMNKFYMCIAPFKVGFIKNNNDNYFEYAIDEIDFENHVIKYNVNSYNFVEVGMSKIWSCGLCSSLSYRIREDGNLQHSATHSNIQLLTIDPIKEFGWGEEYKKHWESRINYVKTRVNLARYQNKLCNEFIEAIVNINDVLLKKNATVRNNKKVKNKIETKVTDKPARVERTIGVIRVLSESKPKKPFTQSKIREYKVLKWKCRGHVRHYKSGKTIYVQESVHTRHVNVESIPDSPKHTIVIKD